MPILDKVKPIIDYPRWRQPAPTLNAHAAGSAICFDKRNDNSRHPLLYQLVSAAVLNAYDPRQDGWSFVGNPGLSAFGAGSCAVFCPSQGVRGTLGSGSTSTSIVVGSVLTAVIAGQLTGNRIRMIGNNNAGSCGRIEERMIIGNSAGTSPTIYLDSPLSYSYISGDAFEIHSGRVYMLGTTAGATQLRYYDTIYQTLTSAGNTTLTIAVDSEMVCLDEDYVPYDRKPGEGLVVTSSSPAITYDTGGIVKYCLQASAVGVGTVTGSAAGGDNNILANEYRNFQIRIVEDTTTPTAVGQRATIASHTAGAASPLIVYTLGANWGVRPSNNAKYVIENPNVILLFAQAAGTTIYTYNPTPATINNGTNTITTGAFSTPYFGVRGSAVGAGTFYLPSWSHEPVLNADGTKQSRHSFIYSIRGGGGTQIDMLDIAGGTTGAWTNALAYIGQQTAFNTASCGNMAPFDQNGMYGYCILNATNNMYRFDIKNRIMWPWKQLPVQSGAAAVGGRVEIIPYMTTGNSPTDKVSLVFVNSHLSTVMYRAEVIS